MRFQVIFFGVVCLALVLGACQNAKKSAESGAKNAVEYSKLEADKEVMVKTQENGNDAVNQKYQIPNYPDSLYFSMDRTPCLGTCPIYTVKVYKSGWALLEGGEFFDFQGQFSASFSEEELNQIQQMAMDAGYAEMKHVYDGPATDLPSTTTILNSEKIQHWVYNRMRSPDELRSFELAIESLIKEKQWATRSKAGNGSGHH